MENRRKKYTSFIIGYTVISYNSVLPFILAMSKALSEVLTASIIRAMSGHSSGL
jgi:heme/copper-type cytochrome/quinol oxidase subunit 4